MDLSELDTVAGSEEGATLHLRHPSNPAKLLFQPSPEPDGEPIPVTITLAGADSERFKRVQRAATNRRLEANRGRRAGKITSEELEADGLESLVACTLAWTGIVLDGQAVECNAVNARKVYTRLPWLREQVDDFVGDRANFIRSSATA